jgi:hypothetical protein
VYGELQSSQTIPDVDESLVLEGGQYGHKAFCHNSPFLRGCVRISAKQKG